VYVGRFKVVLRTAAPRRNRVVADATVTADRAWMHFDVTGLYRTWAEAALDGGARLLSLPGGCLHIEDDHDILPAADGTARARW
jgi:hypothetical protein